MSDTNTHGFIQLPLGGIGKKIPASVLIEVHYDGGTVAFEEGDVLTFSTSTWTGKVIDVEGTIVSGELHVKILEPVPITPTLISGENIIVDGTTNATVENTERSLYYYQQNVIAGGDNMVNTLNITEASEALVTFSEGSPQFDSFGKLQVAEDVTIGEYTFNYSGRDGHFTDTQVLGATITHDQATACMILNNPVTAGSVVKRTTDVHHKYTPAQSLAGIMTVVIGDQGKNSVTRRWGLLSNTDGVFFELVDSILSVVIRSSTSGTPVETRINQADWSVDRMDGSSGYFNKSKITLDITKDNIYWVDFQWLGAGSVRWGVDIGGVRIILHQEDNANKNAISYMRTGSLPMTVEQENTGLSVSTSEMRWFTGSIKSGGSFSPHAGQFAKETGSTSLLTNAGGLVPILSIRPTLTFKGISNHVMILLNHISGLVLDSTGTTPSYAYMEVWKNPTLVGATWADGSVSTESAVEFDTAATALSGGRRVGGAYIGGIGQINIAGFFNYLHENLVNKHDGTQQYYTVALRPMAGVDITAAINVAWKEIRD